MTTGDLLDEDGKLLTEENELWVCDPVDCIWELIGNVAFHNHMVYVCQQVFMDKGETRHYNEMWTGEWWWKTQASPSHAD